MSQAAITSNQPVPGIPTPDQPARGDRSAAANQRQEFGLSPNQRMPAANAQASGQ